MHARLWSRYDLASAVFREDPSPRNEGVVIAAYAEFARSFCPDAADELIGLICRRTAEIVEQGYAA